MTTLFPPYKQTYILYIQTRRGSESSPKMFVSHVVKGIYITPFIHLLWILQSPTV